MVLWTRTSSLAMLPRSAAWKVPIYSLHVHIVFGLRNEYIYWWYFDLLILQVKSYKSKISKTNPIFLQHSSLLNNEASFVKEWMLYHEFVKKSSSVTCGTTRQYYSSINILRVIRTWLCSSMSSFFSSFLPFLFLREKKVLLLSIYFYTTLPKKNRK